MGKQGYELVMSKVDDIAVAVNKFPEGAQGVACKELISALIADFGLSCNGSVARTSVSGDSLIVNDKVVDGGNAAENLERYASNFDLISINNAQFAAFVAYFYCELAPDGVRVDAIDKSHLESACDIVGRNLPARLDTTLSDAKTKGRYRYLISKGTGRYALSHAGKRYIKNELLKRDQE